MPSSRTLRRAGTMAPLAATLGLLTLEFFNHGKASVFCSASDAEAAMTPSRHASADEENANSVKNTSHMTRERGRERRLGDRIGGVQVERSRASEVYLGEDDPASAAPEQVHIALAVTGSREEYAMTIAWATWPDAQSQVLWGSSADQLSNLAEGSATCELLLLLHYNCTTAVLLPL